jgi:hypothetical protein
MDEVEVVAVILKMQQDQKSEVCDDASLCVLNNEKPSAFRKRLSNPVNNHRVKFMLKQESAADSSTDTRGTQQPQTSAICCWLC